MKKAFCLTLVAGALLCSAPVWAAPAAEPAVKAAAKESVSAGKKIEKPAVKTISEKEIGKTEKNKAKKNTAAVNKKDGEPEKESAKDQTEKPSGEEVQDDIPAAPTEEAAAWQDIASNSRYTVAYDTGSIRYDDKTGILTLWNRWTNRQTGEKTLLLSHYDVRLRVYADLVRYEYDGLGNCTFSGKTGDDSWFPLAPDTLGMALCNALKGYLISQ